MSQGYLNVFSYSCSLLESIFLATVQKGVEFFPCFSVVQTVQYLATNASKFEGALGYLLPWYELPWWSGRTLALQVSILIQAHALNTPCSMNCSCFFKIWWIRARFILNLISIKYDTHWVVSTFTALSEWLDKGREGGAYAICLFC